MGDRYHKCQVNYVRGSGDVPKAHVIVISPWTGASMSLLVGTTESGVETRRPVILAFINRIHKATMSARGRFTPFTYFTKLELSVFVKECALVPFSPPVKEAVT